ncbi:DUF5131 family protein, partial [Staphylococcus borealis]|uniref:DUF5131 family protein n=1 Tax=Staphylococcus borealis TaxID=2742203 RepID=UPI0039E73795
MHVTSCRHLASTLFRRPMAALSNISWTDHTWNGWIGCSPISPGCKNCYAERWARRYGRDFHIRTRT